MKQRLLVASVMLVIALVLCAIAFPKYQDYLKLCAAIEENAVNIDQATIRIQNLEKQFEEIRGELAPRTLKTVMGYLGQYDDIEIVEIKSFNMKGDGIEYLGNISSLSDTSLCDGYEVTVTSQDVAKFIEYLDEGNLTFHSADFMFGAKTAVLRIRTGGGLSG